MQQNVMGFEHAGDWENVEEDWRIGDEDGAARGFPTGEPPKDVGKSALQQKWRAVGDVIERMLQCCDPSVESD